MDHGYSVKNDLVKRSTSGIMGQATDEKRPLLLIGESISQTQQPSSKSSCAQQAIFWLMAPTSGAITMTLSFTGLEPTDYMCYADGCNATEFPPKGKQCQRHVGPTCEVESEQICDPDRDTFYYGLFGMTSSLVTEFSLVCRNQYKLALVGSIYMAVVMATSTPIGRLYFMLHFFFQKTKTRLTKVMQPVKMV